MKAKKIVFGSLEKCYGVTDFYRNGERLLVAAAEQSNPCYAYSLDGEIKETFWEEPGGVMTVLQVPGKDILLSTRYFYGPDASTKAEIIYVTNDGEKWESHLLCSLPFVHRFGIITRNGRSYLIACTLKSHHAFPGDWTCPGRVWIAPLPEDFSQYNEENELELYPLMSGIYKNHGFRICQEDGHDIVLVGAENGIFKIAAPETEDGEWEIEQILDDPISDMVYIDFDNDGQMELLTLAPFHGDIMSIYHLQDGKYVKVWEPEERFPFLHAIDQAIIKGKGYAFIGHREGKKQFMAISYDFDKKDYKIDILDQDTGAANTMYYTLPDGNEDGYLFTSNRECDEVAVYVLDAEE